ncbi:MAG: LamG-like jellyroll fold domain-containing protein [Nonlabens sp.]|uniref:LamG-like jellyroll fold domain-containing protein n=1 Tax=Nonlabens sp. TaxID=1888209 RepID=UPI003EF6C4A4
MKTLLLSSILLLSTISLSAQTQNGLTMDGTNDYVSTTYSPPSGNVARSIEAWIKTTANSVPNAGGRQQIIADFGSFTTGGRFTFNVLWGGAIRLEVGGNGVSGTVAVNDGNWHHVAVVYDPANSAGTVALYVDGNLDTTGTPTVSVNIGNTTPFTIGRRVDGVNNFTGSIDEVRFWNRALTPNDLNVGGGSEICPSSTGLGAYFQFNEGMPSASNSGINSLPELVSGNDGTLNGFSLSGGTSNWTPGAPVTRFIDTDVSQNAGVLTAAQSGVTYQWIDCSTNMPITGATGMTFTPTMVGDYAVDITSLGCTQRSDCETVTTLGIDAIALSDVALVQNPSAFLSFSGLLASDTQVAIYTLSGKKVFTSTLNNSQLIQPNISSGLYMVTVSKNGASKRLKWIKE